MSKPVLIHPPNQDFLEKRIPYPLNLPRGLPLAVIISVVTIYLFLLTVTGMGWVFLYHSNQLFKHPVETTATIIERNIFEHDNGIKRYKLGYTFELEGETYTDYNDVDLATYDDLEIGDPISIYYALNDPNYTRVIGFDDEFSLLGYTLLWVFMALVLSGVSYYLIRRYRRLSTLREHGKVISGELIDISAIIDRSDYVVTVNAQFNQPDTHQTLTGKRHYRANHLSDQPLPPVGSRLAIYYYDQKLWEVL